MMMNETVLCEDCTHLRELNGKHIICNIQQAKLYNVQKCYFYQKKE